MIRMCRHNIKTQFNKKTILIFMLMSLLCVCGNLQATTTNDATENSNKEAALNGEISEGLLFSSESTKRQHSYKVYLPEEYASSDKSYPVLYMTDAQWGFRYYAETLDWKNLNIILVGIDSGPERFIDLAGEGADAYTLFFKNEFIPFIETKYRSNNERAYMGVSLGALFGSRLLIQEPVGTAYFDYYMLFDGTYQFLTSEDMAAEDARFERSPSLATTVYLTSAWPGNRKPTQLFKKRYQERQYKGFTLTHLPLEVEHKEVAAPSYAHFIDKIFK